MIRQDLRTLLQNPDKDLPRMDELIRRSRDGDLESFNAVMGVYYPPIFRLAFRILGSREAAEDATQEIFIKAWRNLPRFRGDSRFNTWLHAIAVNHCLDAVRKQGQQLSRTLHLPDHAFDRAALDSRNTPDSGANPAEVEIRIDFREAIGKLPEKQQVIVVLHFYGDYSLREIANLLGLSLSTVFSRLRSALVRLGRTLGKED